MKRPLLMGYRPAPTPEPKSLAFGLDFGGTGGGTIAVEHSQLSVVR